MELPSGHARQLVACVRNGAVGVGSRGVYYVPCDPVPDPPLYVLDPKTGRNERLGRLDGLAERPLGLSVSPDGNTIVYPSDSSAYAGRGPRPWNNFPRAAVVTFAPWGSLSRAWDKCSRFRPN
jgi:hypothetical protein